MIKLVDQFVINMGGRKKDRSPSWNPTDDCPSLANQKWILSTNDGDVTISAYEQKIGTSWPDYPCSGDSYRNKFSVVLARRKPNGLFAYEGTGMVDVSPENLQLHLGRFQGTVVKGGSHEHPETESK